VFFVLSGYLITSLLLAEWTRIGKVRLGAFWVRRARRLLPAVVALLIVVLIAGVLLARDAVPRLRGDIPASLGYVMNWRLIFHKDSYLQTFGRPPLLLHLWSLAIEEQFYLVWPPVVALVLWRGRNRKHLMRVALAGAVASSAAMALEFHPGGNPAAVYFGTGTHAEGLLIGCALAAAIPPWRAGISLTQRGRRLLDGMGFVALAGVIALAATMTQTGTFTYRGGLVLADVATALAVVAAVRSGSWVSRALSPAPFIWAGTRSYSLYLWHWPIYALTQPRTDVPMTGWSLVGFRLALIGVAAELS
jgi:peptidoglycan/LPS O-acetylase OafA/YrhL